MSGQEMPIFTRTFDFLTWLLPITNHFPTAHRHTFTKRLLVHENKAQARSVLEGIPFLGFHIFPDHRRLKRRRGIAFQRKFQKMLHEHAQEKISRTQITASVQGWVNHVRYGNTWGLRRAILNNL